MDNKHSKTPVYRYLDEEEIVLIKRIKELGPVISVVIAAVEDWPDTDQRWAAIAKTDLQKGLMSLIRAVNCPESF
jgi:hypothetical protein